MLSMQGGRRAAVWRIWTEAVPALWRSVSLTPLAIGLGPCDCPGHGLEVEVTCVDFRMTWWELEPLDPFPSGWKL